MNNNNDKVILKGDPSSVRVELTNVYYSLRGQAYLRRESAEHDSYTHFKCTNCGNIVERNSYCKDCSQAKHNEKYNKLPYQEWDGECCVCIYEDDKYFWDSDQIEEYCDDNDIKFDDLQLVICEPSEYRELSSDFFEEIMPEDMDELPKKIQDKINEFNEFMKSLPPLSYTPTNIRTKYISKP